MAKGKTMETTIKISGEIDSSIKKALADIESNMSGLESAAKQAAGAAGELTSYISRQEKELKQAKLAYASYVLAGEESSDTAQELAQKIGRLSSELNDNKSALKQAEKAAERLADGYDEAGNGMDDLGDAAGRSKGGMDVAKIAAGNLAAQGIGMIIDKASEAVSALWGLAESTREFRQDMGTLETAFSNVGFSPEQATDTWKDLYSIFGEDDRAVETANNIARIVDSQSDLDKWTKITMGAWGTYQDALPVENLAEAAGETAKTGTVTGGLADALNWSSEAAEMFADYMGGDVVTAEDAFNKALSECTSEQERQELITDTLLKLYGDAAETYEDTAGSIIDANKANADWNMTMAEMGEAIEPLNTAVKSGMTDMVQQVMGAFEGVDVASIVAGIGSAFQTLGTWLAPVVSALFELGAVVAPIVVQIFSLLSPIIGLVFSAFGQVVSVVSGLISLVWQGFQPMFMALAPVIQWIAGVVQDVLGVAFDTVGNIIDNVKNIMNNLIEFIQNVFTGNWSAAWENIKNIFGSIWDSLKGLVAAPINGVISIINRAIDGINSISVDIPDWVPLVGGKHIGFNVPHIPMLATGGFTDGVSIAGEAGTEAVISFDPAYRKQNLGYWAKAGEILGATGEDAGFSLSGNSDGGTYIDMGGVTFSPNISVQGNADEDSIIRAIEREYPEFMDMLDNYFRKRGLTVYAS